MRKKILLMLFIISAVMVLAGGAMALSIPSQPPTQQSQPMRITGSSAHYQISWDVNASGDETMSSASYTMMSTTGQTVTGEMENDNYVAQNGFWRGVMEVVQVFLPIITR